MSLETIGNGIRTNLGTIAGLRIFAPSGLPDSISTFPTAIILPGEVNYRVAFGGQSDYIFRIIILFTKQDQPSALNKMLDYMETSGTYSIPAAIEADRTLNSSAADCKLTKNLGIGVTNWGGYNYLSTEFSLQVWK